MATSQQLRNQRGPEMTDLQLALDVSTRKTALHFAEIGVDAGFTAIEAGHVLIKREGLSVVSELAKRFPEAEIVADLKAMDMAEAEVGAAADFGASSVIVCAAASDTMLRTAAQVARRTGLSLWVSTMGYTNPCPRVSHLRRLGLDQFIAHRGHDDSFKWTEPQQLQVLEDLLRIPSTTLALAGDISSSTVPQLNISRFSRAIIGRGVTAAPDPVAAAEGVIAAARMNARQQ